MFWLFNHPAPYKIDFFNCLGKECDLTVYFERKTEGKRNPAFYNKQATSFHAIIGNPLPLGRNNSWSRKPVALLKKGNFDVVVLNGWRYFSEMNTISYCKKHKIPYVFYINGGIYKEKEGKFIRFLKKRYIPGATAYLAPDETSKRYLTFYGAKEKDITLYPYASAFESDILKHPRTAEEKKKLRKKLSLEGERIYVSSGQFIERKNYGQLIKIWAKIPREYSLYITGEGPLKDEYLSLIKEEGLSNVHILPYLPHEELYKLFQAADAFVFLSKEDIYGHVVNESLSQGLPVIVSNKVNAGVALIEDGINGQVVDLEDESEIVEAILDAPKYQAEECLKTARKNTYEESAKFHIAYFEDYLKRLGK